MLKITDTSGIFRLFICRLNGQPTGQHDAASVPIEELWSEETFHLLDWIKRIKLWDFRDSGSDVDLDLETGNEMFPATAFLFPFFPHLLLSLSKCLATSLPGDFYSAPSCGQTL